MGLPKLIKTGSEATAELLKGVDTVANAVKGTLGPKGRNVVIYNNHSGSTQPRITKDGVSVAKEITLSNKFEDAGAQLIKSVADRTNNGAGDGTTTATLLTQFIIHKGLDSTKETGNPLDVKKGMEKAVDAVSQHIQSQSKTIEGKDDILNVARISANNESEVADIVTEAIDAVGDDGVLTVDMGMSESTHLDLKEGMQFESGWLSKYFINDSVQPICRLKNPKILIYDGKIDNLEAIKDMVKELYEDVENSLLIVATAVNENVVATFASNKMKKGIRCCIVKSPYYGEKNRDFLDDLATYTGGVFYSNAFDRPLKTAKLDDLGTIGEVIISKTETIMKGNNDTHHNRIEEIKVLLKDTKISNMERERLNERLAMLSGAIGTIYVGGKSEAEVGERRDRVDDAIHATKSAIKSGVVTGGGTALLYAVEALKDLKGENDDENTGIEIIREALEQPIRTIVSNGGGDADGVVAKLAETKDVDFGFDARQEKYVNMFEAGIIDPTEVPITALQNALGVAGILITTGALIIEEFIDEDSFTNPYLPGGGLMKSG